MPPSWRAPPCRYAAGRVAPRRSRRGPLRRRGSRVRCRAVAADLLARHVSIAVGDRGQERERAGAGGHSPSEVWRCERTSTHRKLHQTLRFLGPVHQHAVRGTLVGRAEERRPARAMSQGHRRRCTARAPLVGRAGASPSPLAPHTGGFLAVGRRFLVSARWRLAKSAAISCALATRPLAGALGWLGRAGPR